VKRDFRRSKTCRGQSRWIDGSSNRIVRSCWKRRPCALDHHGASIIFASDWKSTRKIGRLLGLLENAEVSSLERDDEVIVIIRSFLSRSLSLRSVNQAMTRAARRGKKVRFHYSLWRGATAVVNRRSFPCFVRDDKTL